LFFIEENLFFIFDIILKILIKLKFQPMADPLKAETYNILSIIQKIKNPSQGILHVFLIYAIA